MDLIGWLATTALNVAIINSLHSFWQARKLKQLTKRHEGVVKVVKNFANDVNAEFANDRERIQTIEEFLVEDNNLQDVVTPEAVAIIRKNDQRMKN